MLAPLLVSAVLVCGQADATLEDTTQCSPDDVAPHPAEKTVIANLRQAGATMSVNRHGRLLYLYGEKSKLPTNVLGLLDGTPALRGIGIRGITDEMLGHLKDVQLPRLESLHLTRCPVGDEPLKLWRRFPSLNWANLEETRITDRGLECLSHLPKLLGLRLSRTRITDDGLRHLVKLKKLRHLELDDTGITDAGLEHLSKIAALETLYLKGTKITDSGLAHLQANKMLHGLGLDRTAITDAGLAHFDGPGGLRNVKHLYLSRTKVTDAGIRSLDAVPFLQGVSLDGTKATRASVERLKKRPELYWITEP